ncbi:MAG: efflux RND transporter periplasmic adaptor subunit [Alphaproteobacteria bacterium]
MRVLAWIVLLLACLGAAGGLGFYKYSEIQTAMAAAAAAPEPRESVEAVRVTRGAWSATTRAVGTVVALRQVEIRSELAGTVVEVGFASGDVVEKGELLIRLDASQEEAALEAAEAEARLAAAVFERRRQLRSNETVSALELDRAREELAAAEARAAELRAGIAKMTLRAPFRARVGLTDLQPGVYLDAGASVAMLQGVDPDAFVDFALPQDMAAAIRPGRTVTLAGAQIPGGHAEAEIVAEEASVDAANRAVRFRAVVRGLGDSLRPGAFVDVVAATALPQPVLLAPLTAVRRAPYGAHVFALARQQDGSFRARQRAIETGPVQGSAIVIKAGLAEGELIAGAGSFKLRDGLLTFADDPVAKHALKAAPSDRDDASLVN